jgi:negative regulator of flagellin synthesis FlgM
VANTIEGFSANGATSLGTNRTAQSARDTSVASANTNSGGGGEDVQITSTASQLASLGQKLNALPAIDAGRVARISKSLADGSYSISADKIAAGLLQSDRTLAQIGL